MTKEGITDYLGITIDYDRDKTLDNFSLNTLKEIFISVIKVF